jgi:hypothetical protein
VPRLPALPHPPAPPRPGPLLQPGGVPAAVCCACSWCCERLQSPTAPPPPSPRQGQHGVG